MKKILFNALRHLWIPLLTIGVAFAQDLSPKAIRIIVPFAPGGSNDIVGRSMAQQLSTRLKRNVFIENKPGAGGSMGADLVAHA